tara:strand:+ start:149 stop:376 length:228 start_codon:yes stop_codon:yes gene_type:complete
MFAITAAAEIFTIIQAIDGGVLPIAGQSFRDGAEDQIQIDFYNIEGRVIRSEYNRHNTITLFHEITGEDRDRLTA